MIITVYGSRGSIPFFTRDNIRYGGNTACIAINMDGHIVVLDGGSGIIKLEAALLEPPLADITKNIDILIGHLHIDHIIGLSMFSPLLNTDFNIRLFAKPLVNATVSSQLFGIFKPPYWPIDLEKACKSQIIEICDYEPFSLRENIKIIPFDTGGDDGMTAFKVIENKSIVYLTDYEMNRELPKYNELVEFCKGADAVFFDATYLPQDYDLKRGWGHSTYEHGVELSNDCACKLMIFTHFSQSYCDNELDAAKQKIVDGKTKYLFAHDGMTIEL